MTATVLIATWDAGLFVVSRQTVRRELAGTPIRTLASDGHGGALAIVDGHSLRHRDPDGTWTTLATTATELTCCVAVGDVVYVGTDDARVLRVDATGETAPLHGLERVAGRDAWYAGTALVDGRLAGPPLGVRSISASADGGVLLANVHVGGIPRSTDQGVNWTPTIAIDSDVHEVRAHPRRPGVVAAATAAGLGISHDGGATWTMEARGLHAPHCSAVAFVDNDVLVSASTDPFSPDGAIYRRGVDESGPLISVRGGLPAWLAGKVDTGCIASRDATVAIADGKGQLFLSDDHGHTWSRHGERMPVPAGLLIV